MSAARQPVHWSPWGEEAFARARAEDKPILLDVGAVWCHWCHVMDRESYEDPALAAWLNDRFVCIKVDRDERPDVDLRYQRAVQALTGQGGWPLTAVLTPEGDVFYGGTYFPPEDRYGRTGFRTILERVHEVFHADRARVAGSGREIAEHVGKLLVEAAPGTPSPELIARGADAMAQLFDQRHGGFGRQPKFPHPGAVDFLLARWWDTGEERWRAIVETTLTGMALGGVYDQLGGGFHRYAVDERWIVPHFEKMSYDNAELLKAYLHGYAALEVPLFRDVAEGITGWCLEVLADGERGGFGASQDADVGLDDDGDYFTWTADEARAALTSDEWEVARRRWDIGGTGVMAHDPARTVLWVARDAAQIAADTRLAGSRVGELLRSARSKLKAERDRRPKPAVDRAVYVGWNAMLAEAFLEAAVVLERPDCAAFALRTLERLWNEAMRPDGLLRHRADAAAGTVVLEDQAQAASAALAAWQHTGDDKWLARARALAERFTAAFGDPSGAGLLDLLPGAGAGLLGRNAKTVQDAPAPAPNAVAARVLLALSAITEDGRWAASAERVLAAFAGAAADAGVFVATYLSACDALLSGACRIVVADTTTLDTGLTLTALSTWRPRKVVVRAAVSPVPGTPPPVALVCAGTVCAAPVSDAAELRHVLESFARRG